MDAVGVQMITLVREFSSLAGGSDSILCPTEEQSDLSNVECPRAVLEHLWNTTAVHGWGSLVSHRSLRCQVARMNWLGW